MARRSRAVAVDRRYRQIVLAIAAVMAVLLSQVGLTLSVQAADNPDIVVSDLTLTRTNNQNEDWPGKLTVNQHARLDFKWDASNADVKDGDSFTIDLGTYFENLEYPRTAPMTVTNNGEQVDIGTCNLTRTQVVCTFNSKVEELKAAGFTAFRGTGSARLRAVAATTSETADITTNNVVSVDLPGTGGINEDVGEGYETYTFHKWAGALWDETGMTWGINFGTKYLGDEAGLNLDGTRQTIVITDTLGEGMDFRAGNYLKDWVFFYRGTDGDTAMQLTRLTDASGEDRTLEFGDFDMSVEVDGRTATITVTGPFQPNSNYTITYPVTFTGGKVTRGVLYDNSATITGSNVASEDSRYFVESFSITVEMEAGFGGFDITKVVAGTGAASVPAGTEFTVDVTYELPAVASTYEDWTAPGTLNADGKTGTAQMTAVVGQKVPFSGTFPKGTKITLAEDTSSSTYTAVGWSDPEFVIGGRTTNQLTIGDQTSTAVTLTNTTAPQGTFAIKKNVSGADEATSKQFTFNYECSDSQTGSVTVPGDGSAVPVGISFPIGTTCTVTEQADSAQLDGYTLDSPAPQTVEITTATNVLDVSFTNAYTRDTGSFAVKKVVTGDYNPGADELFTVNYRCNDADGTSGSLSVPANGSAVSVDGLPTGTTCVLGEDTDSAQRDGYALAVDYNATNVEIVKDTPQEVTVTNNYTRLVGGFTIAKTVDGDGADRAPASFDFEYSCIDKAGDETVSGTLTVSAGSSASVPNIPTGTCRVSEKDAAVPNTQLATKLTVDGQDVDGNVATIDVENGSAIAIEATNTYTLDRGKFSVKKTVSGNSAATSKDFTFNYTCSNGQSGVLTVPGDGTVVESDKSFPLETTCEVSEDSASAQIDEYSVRVPDPQTVTISDESKPVEVSFANDYKRLVGGFSISKKVDGDGANLAPASFAFDYACVDAAGKETASGTLAVNAGESAALDDIPTGTCEVTERDAAVNGAQLTTSWTVDGASVEGSKATINVTDGSAIAVEATNTYTRDRGSFSVAKKVTGDYTPGTGESFKVNYVCDDPDQTSGVLDVPADGTPVQVDNLPTGTSCVITEDGDSARRDGYAVATTHTAAKVTITKDQTQEDTITNDYRRLVGGFTIAKTVDGDGANLAPQSFDFDYTCVDGAGNQTVSGTLTVQAGKSEQVTDVPVGSCTITEKDASVANTQLATKLTVDGDAVDGSSAKVEIGDGSTIAIEATNTYTMDRGSFSVAKKVSGADKAKNKNFTFAYECSDGSIGSLTVPGDGTVVKADKTFPVGTTCEVTEDGNSAQLSGYTVKIPDSQKVSIEEKDKVVELNFTNTYTENTPPPSKTPTPKKSLPRTGADLRVPGLLALLAVSLGGGVLWLRRRKA